MMYTFSFNRTLLNVVRGSDGARAFVARQPVNKIIDATEAVLERYKYSSEARRLAATQCVVDCWANTSMSAMGRRRKLAASGRNG